MRKLWRGLAVACLLFVVACAGAETAKQKAFAVGARYEAAALAAVKIVTAPETPAAVKSAIKSVDAVAYAAVSEAVRKARECADPCALTETQLGVGAASAAMIPFANELIKLGVEF